MNLERLSTAFEQSSATNPKLQVSDIKPNIFLMTRSFARSQVEITVSACIPIDPSGPDPGREARRDSREMTKRLGLSVLNYMVRIEFRSWR